MKVTLFTSNHLRHNYLINLLSNISEELFVVQENTTIFPGVVPDRYPATNEMKKYFSRVTDAQLKVFGKNYIDGKNRNIKILPIKSGDLSQCSLELLKDFLNSDIYIVFGSSFIKNDLIKFLLKNRAINIHMGISPYYRGTDCNFWALYDGNPHLVGATIHLLSSGLDSGAILYHALSEKNFDPFLYTMSTVKSAFHSLSEKIKNGSVFKMSEDLQDKSKEIRYSKKIDFTNQVVKEFFEKKINMDKKFDQSLLKDPYFLK